MRTYRLSDFDFALPPELIAQHPAAERSAARLLDGTTSPPSGRPKAASAPSGGSEPRAAGSVGATSPPPGRPKAASAPSGGSGPREAGERGGPVDRIFHELPELLRAGDLLVFNDTQVIKARLFGEKPTGGKLELLVERVLADGSVAAHMKVSKKPPIGTVLRMHGGFSATLLGRWPDADGALFHFAFTSDTGEDAYALMQRCGHVPLPPYIERQQADATAGDAASAAEDERRYQTVFARVPGAVAAPTAALHFDDALLERLAARGVQRASVTLHVGAGTFQPVKTENLAEHAMHAERYHVPPDTQRAIADCHARGGRVVAVGTTTVRTLEAWAASGEAEGDTRIFITPGFVFRHVDLMVTNFHLPKSTLMMLISAFAGHAHVMALYRHAIAARYRFFSYGDAMLLERNRE